MNNITHLIYTIFTGRGQNIFGGYKGDKWFSNRIEIFKNFTLKSLLNQTNKNFIHLISFRPEEKNNPLVKDLEKYLKNLNYPFIFTFTGMLIWDDRGDCKFDLLRRLKLILPAFDFIKTKYIYQTILDSDDMYSKDSIETIQKQPFRYKGAFGFTKGYILNAQTLELAEYNPNPNAIPPFYTIMFPTKVFLNPLKHFNYIESYKSHEYIKNYFKFKSLEGRKFCVVIHGLNLGTIWEHPFKGKKVDLKILENFGIKKIKPVLYKSSFSMKIKKLFNHLPFNQQIRNIAFIRKLWYKIFKI